MSVGLRKRKRKEVSGKLYLFRNCGLLLWLVRAQHVHTKTIAQEDLREICLPLHYESESEKKSPDFHLCHQHQNVCNTKKILRGINFVKITENIFQPPAPKETKNTTSVWRCQLILIAAFSYKKSVAPTNSCKDYKKNTPQKSGGELICKNFGGVNGNRYRVDGMYLRERSWGGGDLPITSFEAQKKASGQFSLAGERHRFSLNLIKHLFLQTLHFMGKLAIPRERESYAQGKIILQREKFPLRMGKFTEFPLDRKSCLKRCLG